LGRALTGEPSADNGFGAALSFEFGRHRIDLGGVEDVDAAVDRIVHLPVALRLGVLLAEGHGAEAELAHLHGAAAESAKRMTHLSEAPN